MNNLLKELEKERGAALKYEFDNDYACGYLYGIEKAIEIVKKYSTPNVVEGNEQLPCGNLIKHNFSICKISRCITCDRLKEKN